jgi:hypothetical protein
VNVFHVITGQSFKTTLGGILRSLLTRVLDEKVGSMGYISVRYDTSLEARTLSF